jgi:hypothetical protein
MKKIIMLAVVLTTITLSSFAGNVYTINKKAVSTFNKTYQYAEDVRWELRDNLYKVSFKSNGSAMFAYYNADGEQVAITRNIHSNQLPITLSNELKGYFNDSWVTELFEVSSNGETAYYATVENATHITVLKAEGTSGWSLFKKDKRK